MGQVVTREGEGEKEEEEEKEIVTLPRGKNSAKKRWQEKHRKGNAFKKQKNILRKKDPLYRFKKKA